MSALKPRPCSYSLHKIRVTVFAHAFFKFCRHPYPVPHADAPCKLHVAVAALGMRAEFVRGELE